MAFVTDAQVKSFVAALLHKDPGDLPAFWDPIITAANTKAYGEIRRRLLGQGYSAAQLLAWDDGVEFSLDISAYWVFVHGVLAEQVDDKLIAKLDRREELAAAVITNGGAVVVPADVDAAFGVGGYDGSGDMFGTPLDSGDDRVGEVTSW